MCGDAAHQFVLSHFDDEPEIYISVKLNKHGFLRRVKEAFRYVFGMPCKYGEFDEVILKEAGIARLYGVLQKKLMENHLRGGAAFRAAPNKCNMDNIKFRGKDASTGEWVHRYPVFVEDCLRGREVCVMYSGFGDLCVDAESHDYVRVDPDTVGQFTGVYDSDGNEIYEGDIVKTSFGEKPFGVVVRHPDGYWCIDESLGEFPVGQHRPLGEMVRVTVGGNPVRVTVIGNMHDNPEMMSRAEGAKE